MANGYCYNKPTSLLHNLDEDVMSPVFKRCSKKLGGVQHQHQPLEGSAPGYGSRTKLAQVYPHHLCSKLIRCILPLGSPRGLFHAQTTVAVDLLDGLDIPSLESLHSFLMENTDREFVHFSKFDSVTVNNFYVRRLMNRVNSLPFRDRRITLGPSHCTLHTMFHICARLLHLPWHLSTPQFYAVLLIR